MTKRSCDAFRIQRRFAERLSSWSLSVLKKAAMAVLAGPISPRFHCPRFHSLSHYITHSSALAKSQVSKLLQLLLAQLYKDAAF